MKKNNHLTLNSIFVHGFFKTSEVFERKVASARIGRHKLQIGGNNIQVYRNVRSYTINLVKNIESFLNLTKLRKVVAERLHEWCGWKIRKITAQITNYQASGTFEQCDNVFLCLYVIPHLIKLGQIHKRIRFGDTFYFPSTDSVWANDYSASTVLAKEFGYFTLCLEREQKVKFQWNKKQCKVHITLILDCFDSQVKAICEEINCITSELFFEQKNKQSENDVRIWFKRRQRIKGGDQKKSVDR